MQPPTRSPQLPSLRSALAYPVPYAALLLLVPLWEAGEPIWWRTISGVPKAAATFAGIIVMLVAFQVIADTWYRWADPHGLGRKGRSRADRLHLLSCGGPMAMTLAWVATFNELPPGSIWGMVVLGSLWALIFGLLASAAETAGRVTADRPPPRTPFR